MTDNQTPDVDQLETTETPEQVEQLDTDTAPEQQPDEQNIDEQPDDSRLKKARREAADYRTRLRDTETRLTNYRNHIIDHALGAGNITRDALEAAGTDLDTLISDDGTINTDTLNTAITTTRTKFGIPNNRFQGTADQGARYRGTPDTRTPTWSNLTSQ